jgi:hypothetical protein
MTMGGGGEGPGGGEPGGDTIGVEDVARLNNMAVERAGAFARMAGVVLIVVGAIGVLGWLWISVRQQQVIDDPEGGRFGFGDGDPSLVERVDSLVEYIIFLPWSVLTIGAGFGLRLAADYAAARHGGSLSALRVGDPVPDGGLSHDPQTIDVDPFRPT